jgi:hypothetical protein
MIQKIVFATINSVAIYVNKRSALIIWESGRQLSIAITTFLNHPTSSSTGRKALRDEDAPIVVSQQ